MIPDQFTLLSEISRSTLMPVSRRRIGGPGVIDVAMNEVQDAA
jgi:hypothetical protein